MIVPVGGGPGMFKYALMDQNGPEKVQKYCSRMHGLAKHWLQCFGLLRPGFLSGHWLTVVLELGCSLVGLDGPEIGRSLPEDLVVLDVGMDGPVSAAEWSCKHLIPMGILLCLCEGIFLLDVGILWTWRVVLRTACSVAMSVPVPAVSDSLCRHDESATTSAGEPSVSLVSQDEVLPSVSSVLHSLLLGKGMDRLLQVITCGLPCSQLRAASL